MDPSQTERSLTTRRTLYFRGKRCTSYFRSKRHPSSSCGKRSAALAARHAPVKLLAQLIRRDVVFRGKTKPVVIFL
jgi:hypothetical protein